MPFKDKKKQTDAQHAWYLKNKNKLLEKQREFRRKARDTFTEYKRSLKCEKCGESDPVCLDFHHRDPTQKEIGISDAVNSKWTLERLKKEIEKCIVVCANCHRKIHEYGD